MPWGLGCLVAHIAPKRKLRGHPSIADIPRRRYEVRFLRNADIDQFLAGASRTADNHAPS